MLVVRSLRCMGVTPLKASPVGRKVKGAAGPSPDDPLMAIVNRNGVESARLRRDSASSFELQKKLVRKHFAALRSEDDNLSGDRSLLASPSASSYSPPLGACADEAQRLCTAGKWLLAFATTFHLGAIAGADPLQVEAQVATFSRKCMVFLGILRSMNVQLANAQLTQSIEALALFSAAFFSAGVREWGLMTHHLALPRVVGTVDDWESSPVWRRIVAGSNHGSELPSRSPRSHPVELQRLLFITIPVALISAHWRDVEGSGLRWTDRLALLTLAYVLRLVAQLPSGEGFAPKSASDRKSNTPSSQRDQIFEAVVRESHVLSRPGHLPSDCLWEPVPQWGLGIIAAAGRGDLSGDMIRAWWATQRCHVDEVVVPWRRARGRQETGGALVLPAARVTTLFRSIKDLPCESVAASPPTSGNVTAVAPVAQELGASVTSPTRLLRKALFHADAVHIRNSRIELATLVHDALVAMPTLSTKDAAAFITEVRRRLQHSVADTIVLSTLSSVFRAAVLRYACSLLHLVERKRDRSPSDALAISVEIQAFRQVYQTVGDVATSLGIPDHDLHPKYWEAVAMLLS